jgi:putative inorganic carbon (HCO3(-)) transporter
MSLRDLLVLTIVLAGALVAIRRPWIGVMLWTWLSIMNPHRYTWGWAYDAPVAAIAAASTLLGLLLEKNRDSPFKGGAVVAFALFCIWITLSWAFGLDPANDYEQWNKVMKINLMILVSLSLLRTKEHIFALMWVCAGSLALLGIKGGIYTIAGGGTYRVWGPVGSFIHDNNEFGLAMVMTVPLLRFLQLQLTGFWKRQALTAAMLLCAASALGTHSRGALLAIAAMALWLWWRGKSRFLGGMVIVFAGIALLAFMPEHWTERMTTITEYEQDSSALGRFSAWWTAWGIARDYPLGIGFNAARESLFAQYSPYFEGTTHAAHSIYFQVMGNHGFVGLALFLAIWIGTWHVAGWLRRQAGTRPETAWCADLGAMCQVSLIGYAVGGAFLSLSYFDLPYNIMVMVLLTRAWVLSRGWEREPAYRPGWRTIPGLAKPAGAA